jgi:hypothetical protein
MVIEKKSQPNVWFFTTVHETSPRSGAPRCRLCDGQYIPTDNSDGYEKSYSGLNVNADDSLRKGNAIGTIFYTTSIKKISPPNKTQYYTTGDVKDVGTLDSNQEAKQAYAALLKGQPAQLKSLLKPKKHPKDKKPKAIAGSKLETLLASLPIPTPKTDNFYVSPTNWMRVVSQHARKNNLMFTGPSGTGKTTLSKLIASRTGLHHVRVDFGGKLDAVSTLIGTHRHDPEKGSYFDPAPFLLAIQKPGIVLLDEVNRAPAAGNNILFPLLDGAREITIDQELSKGNRTVKVHEDCIFHASCNTGFEYTGANPLDPAFKSRFKTLEIDYPPAREEERLLALFTKAEVEIIGTIVAAANTIRALHKEGELSSSIGLRETIDCAQCVEDGFQLPDAFEHAFLPKFEHQDQEQVLDIIGSL